MAFEADTGDDGQTIGAASFSLTELEKTSPEQWLSLWERSETTPEEAVAMSDNPKPRIAITMNVGKLRDIRTDLDEEARLDVVGDPWDKFFDDDGTVKSGVEPPPGAQGHCALSGLGVKAPRPISKPVMRDLRRQLLEYVNGPEVTREPVSPAP
ncbi:MAG: hypothetical protein AAF594_05035 [Bacteroidota bacterium]